MAASEVAATARGCLWLIWIALGSLFLFVLGSKITLLMADICPGVQDSLRILISLRTADEEKN